ncbi:similar to An01g02280 [Aspergillus luchuensis]|nr:similar to An01g02280 [Aspergillus luchuensis]
MSTQQDPTPSNEGKHDGLSKYVKRMKMALRRSSTVRTTSPVMQKSREPEPSQAPAPQRIPQAPTVKATPDATVFTNWGAIQEEKARALFAKYGLTLEPGEWRSPSDTTVQRVVRPIRMRVRRTCHRCQTTFGPNKVCVNCQHVRCKSCPHHPSTKTNDHRDDTQAALQAIVAQKLHKTVPVQHKPKQPPLTLPSRTGGQIVIHHPIRQRVRRTCHQCSTVFAPDATECSTCQHIRCTMCPRDPCVHPRPIAFVEGVCTNELRPKLGKYPHGYPGDVDAPAEPPARTWKKARQRVRYTCHKCSTLYRSGERNCSGCGQEKGPETIRDPPRRDKPKPDPEIVRRVEERLAKVRISTG